MAIGYGALSSEDANSYNVAIGDSALNQLNAGANGYNVAVGYQAGHDMSTGTENTLIGGQTGDALTTGIENTAVGYQALSAAQTSHANVAIGHQSLALQSADGYTFNTAVGYNSGQQITSGGQNVILGSYAGDALTRTRPNTPLSLIHI